MPIKATKQPLMLRELPLGLLVSLFELLWTYNSKCYGFSLMPKHCSGFVACRNGRALGGTSLYRPNQPSMLSAMQLGHFVLVFEQLQLLIWTNYGIYYVSKHTFGFVARQIGAS